MRIIPDPEEKTATHRTSTRSSRTAASERRAGKSSPALWLALLAIGLAAGGGYWQHSQLEKTQTRLEQLTARLGIVDGVDNGAESIERRLVELSEAQRSTEAVVNRLDNDLDAYTSRQSQLATQQQLTEITNQRKQQHEALAQRVASLAHDQQMLQTGQVDQTKKVAQLVNSQDNRQKQQDMLLTRLSAQQQELENINNRLDALDGAMSKMPDISNQLSKQQQTVRDALSEQADRLETLAHQLAAQAGDIIALQAASEG
ncbi:hypothetical protein [Larsenimonas rhizosphaerae]|uniref:Uncharacterized protein n=1 Tax=Larsenimonas rhizosphaerae TaxID=2944682 RepID=A0AA42CX27_9GAMM|nr:hypothetical protein [Larsenimonas rhizosphaerae]MCX2523388.1 hypothetical protein [Larsenimonas rhizosphaerae]